MSKGFVFWLLMILWLLFGVWGLYSPVASPHIMFGGNLLLFALFFLLGWKVFGFIINDSGN